MSEAPVYRIFGSQTGALTGNKYRYYVLADWLMENTVLREPLLWWADWWGVGEEFRITSNLRRGAPINRQPLRKQSTGKRLSN